MIAEVKPVSRTSYFWTSHTPTKTVHLGLLINTKSHTIAVVSYMYMYILEEDLIRNLNFEKNAREERPITA